MSEPTQNTVNTNVVRNFQTAEYGKFVEILDSKYPAISVTRFQYPDNSNAFPGNANLPPISSVEVYPKYAVLTHISNTDDLQFLLSANEVNIELAELEMLTVVQNAQIARTNSLLEDLSARVSLLESYTNDLEKNTFDTASACDDTFWETVKLNKKLEDSSLLDAFGRLRISNPLSLFDYKSIYDDGFFFWNRQTRDATDIYQTNDSSRVFTLTAANGYLVKETYRRFGYQPGKSQLCMFTGVLSAENQIRKRSGMFRSSSTNNYSDNIVGIYFEAYSDGSTPEDQKYAWVINNNSNLVPSQSATQAQWNLDKMDGTGPSGINLDFSKAQIFLFDFEWLGVGRVRCGFNINGKTYYCHEFLNANNINGPYITDPNLPLRQEIRSTGGIGSMKTICCSVISEGGTDSPAYVTRSVSLTAGINPANNNRRGLLGIRLKPNRLDATNEIVGVEVFPQVNQLNTFSPFKWELVLRPTQVEGVNWVNYGVASSMQYAYGSSTVQVSGGTIVASGFGNRDTKIELIDPLFNKCVRLGRSLTMIPDELWIVITYLEGNISTWASMTWGEAD